MTARRLAKGGHIDRSTPLSFSWDGISMKGFTGDTLASALMANGEQILGRSFKYHRPRGIMSAGVEESGALVTVGEGARRDANVRATTQPLYDGLGARGQNAWPSVRTDFAAVNNLFGRFFAAGFYYKTFMGLPPFEWGRGTGMWMRYEKIIRKAAGMGQASREADPDHYEHAHGYCDLLVVGSGPAGRAAALAAALAGCDVVLVEQDATLGVLGPAGDLSVVRVQERPDGIDVAKEVMGQAQHRTSRSPPPVTGGGDAKRADTVDVHKLPELSGAEVRSPQRCSPPRVVRSRSKGRLRTPLAAGRRRRRATDLACLSSPLRLEDGDSAMCLANIEEESPMHTSFLGQLGQHRLYITGRREPDLVPDAAVSYTHLRAHET